MGASRSATSSPWCSSASLATEGRVRGVLPAVCLVSAAAMADEVLLIRLLSLRFWPHFVPLVVSLAMLGFGAAGVALALLRHPLGRASQRVPLDPFLLLWEPSAWPPFALFLALLALPFLLSGAATGLPLAFPMGRPGQVYAASFLGSAAGALLSEGALALLPTESLLRLPSALGALAALPLVLDP